METCRLFLRPQRFITLLCAVGLLLAIVGCGDPAGQTPDPSDSPTVSLGPQTGILAAGVAGSATYSVTATRIEDGMEGSINWYGSSDGSTPTSTPAGISASMTPVSDNTATVTMTASTGAVVGSYYFNLALGTTSTAISTLTVVDSHSISFEANGGSGEMPDQLYGEGQSLALNENTLTAPSGCAFACWTTSITGPGTSFSDQAGFTMGSSDVTLYAVWLPTTIRFTSFGNTIAIAGYTTEPTGAFSIPCGVTMIGNSALSDCDGLTSVTIPSSVTSIGSNAFSNTNLTSVTIPSSVTSIGDLAFAYCENLTSVTIPSSVTSIGYAAFRSCGSLASIVIDANNPSFSSASGALFNKDQTTIIQAPGALSGSYVIPSSVTSIDSGAFYDSKLTSVFIPSSVTSIGETAFGYCDSLASIVVEPANPNYSSGAGILFNKVQTTLLAAPGGLSGSYTIPSSVTTIDDYAFFLCSRLTSLTIPSSVTSIGEYAISYCRNLSSIYEQAASPPVLGVFTINNAASDFAIYVPSASVATYKSAAGWSAYADKIQGY